jgi:hypothetical protein
MRIFGEEFRHLWCPAHGPMVMEGRLDGEGGDGPEFAMARRKEARESYGNSNFTKRTQITVLFGPCGDQHGTKALPSWDRSRPSTRLIQVNQGQSRLGTGLLRGAGLLGRERITGSRRSCWRNRCSDVGFHYENAQQPKGLDSSKSWRILGR